jgi:hypothetical protein
MALRSTTCAGACTDEAGQLIVGADVTIAI